MFKRFHKQLLILFTISSIIILISVNLAIAKKKQTEGTVWDVYPEMSREEIQAVVNGATDGDTIYFHAGTYDFSDAPIVPRYANEGAINIIDKSLIIKGEKGTIIKGRESENGAGLYAKGLNAFHVRDSDATRDVTFDGLTIQIFMRGIAVWNNVVIEPLVNEYCLPSMRNVTVKNCTFSDIHRDAISIANVRGDILTQNNDISTDRGGMYISWYNSKDHQDWQPEDTFVHVLENKINTGRWGLVILSSTNFVVKQNSIDCERFGILNSGARKGTVISSNSLFNSRWGVYISGWWEDGIKIEAEGAVIEKNKLFNMTRMGILIDEDASSGHTVSKNEINMAPNSFAGIYTEAHDNYYGQNKIKGSGLTAFWLGWKGYFDENGDPVIFYAAHHETLQANNVNQFLPDLCHFFLDEGTHDNLIIGSGMGHNSYIDNGENNRITGVAPMAGGIGEELREAIKKRNEELKEAREIKF
ncbi:MAG: nitrous oxide reductase family maturation protein NosD [Candidatus Aminicenantia bacterium]